MRSDRPEKVTSLPALEGGLVALRRLGQPSPAKPDAGPALRDEGLIRGWMEAQV